MPKQLAIVTGANRGIGFEVCRQLARSGRKAILTSRNPDKGKRAAEDLRREQLDVDFHALDVTDPGSIDALRQFLETEYDRLDILINNAAIDYDTDQNVLKPDFGRVQRALDTNLLGVWRVSAALLPLMQRSGWGRVVNVSSGSGALADMGAGTPAYGIAKAAVNALTIKLAKATVKDGILVNAVCPGWVRTDMGGSAASRSVEQGAASIMWAVELKDDGPSGGFFRDGRRVEW